MTSWRFIDSVSQIDLESLDEQLLFLEDVRAALPLRSKLKGALLSYLPKRIVSRLYTIDEEEMSVILFTSGTEALPKGFPHRIKNPGK